MEKRIISYLKYLQELVKRPDIVDGTISDEERKLLYDQALVQIGFFQHEREVHLMVTVLFALLLIISFVGFILSQNLGLMALMFLILVLLLPYIKHYYVLENDIQFMYECMDKLEKESWLKSSDYPGRTKP